jgi:hypothetical protein
MLWLRSNRASFAGGQRQAEPAAMPVGAEALELRVRSGHLPSRLCA